MIGLFKYYGQTPRYVYYKVPSLQGKVPPFEEIIDAILESKTGLAIQEICDKLFLEDKTYSEIKYRNGKMRIYKIDKTEIMFFKIVSKIASKSGNSYSKLLQTLAKLPKEQLQERLVLLKVLE